MRTSTTTSTGNAESARRVPAFSRILLPLDGTAGAERAIGPATALAAAGGSALWPVSAALSTEADDRLHYLEQVAATLDVPKVQPELLDREGAAVVIESLALSYNRLHSGGLVICMSTHARGPIPELVLGSTAAAVVRAGAAPVVLVGPEARSGWSPRNLVVCLDGSALSEAVLPLAATWASAMGLGCWLVQVVDDEVVSGLDTPESAYVRNVAGDLRARGLHADWEVLHGPDVGAAIAEFATTVPGALVALTTHGRSGLQLVTMGSTATSVVRHSQTPVVVLRPAS